MGSLRRQIIRLAHANPELRPHLVPLVVTASDESERLRVLWEEYKKEHPESKKPPQSLIDKAKGTGGDKDQKSPEPDQGPDQKSPDQEPEKGDTKTRSRLRDLFSKVKGASYEMMESVRKAPAAVHKFILDHEHRNKTLKGLADQIKASPKQMSARILDSARSELHEIGHAVKAVRKLFKKPPEKLDKKDKAAMYSAGAYAAGALLAGTPAGSLLLAAGAVGKAFAAHVGIKAVHRLMDKGFLHFEWGESLLHGAHPVLHDLAGGLHHVLASDGDEDNGEILFEGLTRVIADTLAKGVSEDEMKEILRGVKVPDEEDAE